MKAWMQSLVSAIKSWGVNWRIRRESIRVAREIYPSLWESVRRKVAGDNGKELAEYAGLRAAQLAQERVDLRMATDGALSGEFATGLVLASTERATKRVLATVASIRNAAA